MSIDSPSKFYIHTGPYREQGRCIADQKKNGLLIVLLISDVYTFRRHVCLRRILPLLQFDCRMLKHLKKLNIDDNG